METILGRAHTSAVLWLKGSVDMDAVNMTVLAEAFKALISPEKCEVESSDTNAPNIFKGLKMIKRPDASLTIELENITVWASVR